MAEYFRYRGFDGIKYKSGLGKACNIALFDIHAAKCGECLLYITDSVDFGFRLEEEPSNVEIGARLQPPRLI